MPPRTSNFPTVARMWAAYAIAPSVAPLSFVTLLFILYAGARLTGSYFNPASILILPALALTVGMLASYAVAGFIGMPIAFVLRKRGTLNFLNIHVAAFAWACVFAAVFLFWIGGNGVPPSHAAVGFFYVLAGVTPPILLSATTFWIVVRQSPAE